MELFGNVAAPQTHKPSIQFSDFNEPDNIEVRREHRLLSSSTPEEAYLGGIECDMSLSDDALRDLDNGPDALSVPCIHVS